MAWPVMSGGGVGGEEDDQPGDVVGGAEAQFLAEEVGHRLAGVLGLDAVREGRDGPGHRGRGDRDTALTVTPARSISSAQVRTMPTMPALAAA